MRWIWFHAVPEFVGRSCDCACWAAILEMHNSVCDFHPKLLVELCFCNDCLDSLHDCSVGMLCHSILVWAVWRCSFMHDARAFEMTLHPFLVLATAICSETLDTPALLCTP